MGTWKLSIQFESSSGQPRGFHIGSGYGFAGRIDRSLARDHNGLPYIPGSTLKGKLRHAAREISEALEHSPCGSYCIPARGKTPCIICSLFGSPFLEGKLRVSDACCELAENPILGMVAIHAASAPRIWVERNGVAISRAYRTAVPGHFFRTECAPEGLRLEATLAGMLSDEPDLALLKAAAKTICTVGGDSARGLGGCRCQIL